MQDEEFEWDDDKAERNLADHAVSFAQAREAFRDGFAYEFVDDRFEYEENRYCLIGMAAGKLIHVTFTSRDNRTRIISARGAEPHERRKYYKANRDQ